MGSIFSANLAFNNSRQLSVNQVLQQSDTLCFANCKNVVGNVNFIINNGSRVGDIRITQECSANSLCSVKNSMDAVAQQVLESYNFAEAKWRPSCFFKAICINGASNTNQQYLFNTTTQVFRTACVASAESSATNINVYVNDNSALGGFTIEQSGQASADCTLDNSARSYASQSSRSEQTATASHGLSLLVIMAIIVAVIVTVIFYFNTSLKREQIKAKNELAIAQLNSGNTQIAEAVFLGNNPEYKPYLEAARKNDIQATALASLIEQKTGIPAASAYQMIKGS